MFPLRYLLDARAVGTDLWVLLGPSLDGPVAIRVVRPDGTMGPRLEVPGVVGAERFAVDASRGRLYLAVPSSAELLRVDLGPAWRKGSL